VRWPQLHERQLFTSDNEANQGDRNPARRYVRQRSLDTRLLLNNLITVHPLGGCPMGDDPRNARGRRQRRVYDDRAARAARQKGLYVADASVIPTIARREPAASRSRRFAERIAETSPTTSAGAPPRRLR